MMEKISYITSAASQNFHFHDAYQQRRIDYLRERSGGVRAAIFSLEMTGFFMLHKDIYQSKNIDTLINNFIYTESS
jgi:hypothetical protein